jgi:type II secretory pathway pseudopilin PulG
MRTPSFTLLEVLVAMTIIATATALVTLNHAGMTDAAQLRAAADQIGGLHRLSAARARAGGLPHVLVLRRHSIGVRWPVQQDGEWTWSQETMLDLPPKVSIDQLWTRGGSTELPANAAESWMVPIRPGGNANYRIRLRVSSGLQADVEIDGFTGVAELRLPEGEPR